MSEKLWTVGAVLKWTAEYFAEKGIDSARLDAEVLLAHALEKDRLFLYMNMDRPLGPEERSNFRELVRRRGAREPVALLTGHKEFWSIPFRAFPGVLIPRPDTEILVEAVLDEIKDIDSPHILELGTGSGAVAVALASERPDARITATDIDINALTAAGINAEAAGTRTTVDLVASDLFTAFRAVKRFHVVCSNPPYVRAEDIDGLAPEIVSHEPRRALDGGKDGLEVIGRIIAGSADVLFHEGLLALEVGDNQADAVMDAMRNRGFTGELRVVRDLSGTGRVVRGRKQ